MTSNILKFVSGLGLMSLSASVLAAGACCAAGAACCFGLLPCCL